MSQLQLKPYPLYSVLSQLLSLSRPEHEYTLCVIEAEESEVFNHYQGQIEKIEAQRDELLAALKKIMGKVGHLVHMNMSDEDMNTIESAIKISGNSIPAEASTPSVDPTGFDYKSQRDAMLLALGGIKANAGSPEYVYRAAKAAIAKVVRP